MYLPRNLFRGSPWITSRDWLYWRREPASGLLDKDKSPVTPPHEARYANHRHTSSPHLLRTRTPHILYRIRPRAGGHCQRGDVVLPSVVNARLLNRTEEFLEGVREAKNILYDASVKDELSGLYNRRGFLTLSDERIKIACSGQRERLVVLPPWTA